MMEEQCKNCIYAKYEKHNNERDMICTNEDSIYYSDYIEPKHTCCDFEDKN